MALCSGSCALRPGPLHRGDRPPPRISPSSPPAATGPPGCSEAASMPAFAASKKVVIVGRLGSLSE